MEPKTTDVIAIVLAGGWAAHAGETEPCVPKPLMTVFNKPLASFVILALQQSSVAKICIVHDAGVQLQSCIEYNEKCLFIAKSESNTSLGHGILQALAFVEEYYGAERIARALIMIVPCDTPLVKPETFESLIRQAERAEGDVVFTIIPERELSTLLPGRRHHRIYLKNFSECITTQNVTFIRGSLITGCASESIGYIHTPRTGGYARIIRIARGIDTVRRIRSNRFLTRVYLLSFFFRNFAGHWYGALFPTLRLVTDTMLARLTLEKISDFINNALRIRPGFIISDRPEISFDIDTHRDCCACKRMDAVRISYPEVTALRSSP
jgi:molybdopterin-guanine dinucleotide biosynthesis protein A